MNVGRNDPCPCGSGKKYKKCCLGRMAEGLGASPMQDLMAEIGRKLNEGEFSSLEAAQAELDTHMHQKNSAPLDDFHGLSPAQMYRLLHFPFESPDLVRFAEDFEKLPVAPVLTLFALLADALGENNGLKATATGNLPRRFCQEAALYFLGEEQYAERIRYGGIRSELDFFEMHSLRLVAELAGLVRKYKGKFVLTGKCRKKLASNGVGAVYYDLFRAYVEKFNWAYCDGYQEIPFIQQSFLFTLFLLGKYGNKEREQLFYEDIFLKAFPALLEEIGPRPYQTVEETVRKVYFYRTLKGFVAFFGLAEVQATSKEILCKRYTIKKLPLLDQYISFTV
ncbi:MAG: SEC-C metal-binding domain-containing protein [Desulfobulbaceae bacterium]|nr:SEC-C metal-binding domain-containing protein [Desulfobulbaceae bacterium]